MSTKIIKTIIRIRRDTEAGWLANKDVIPASGEPCLTLDGEYKGQVKYGDGVSTWEQLSYSGGTATKEAMEEIREQMTGIQAEVTTVTESVTTLQEIVAGKADANNVYTKDEVDSLVKSAMRYVGSVADMDELNAIKSPSQGDVYQVQVPPCYKIYDGSEWDDFNAVDLSGYVTKTQLEKTVPHVEYEILNAPEGTLVDYRDKEIRIMVPKDAEFVLQNVGPTGDANNYYIAFRAYAPSDDVVSFKEDLGPNVGITDQTMYTFDQSFAGIDEYGRKYSLIWLGVAHYDTESGTWTYYGANSSKSRYIGWYYTVEWYDINGIVVGSDAIRIGLSNEECHNAIEPYYVTNFLKGVQLGSFVLSAIEGVVTIPLASEGSLGVVKGSDAMNGVSIAEDGTMEVNSLSTSKLVQDEGETLILDGGTAAL